MLAGAGRARTEAAVQERRDTVTDQPPAGEPAEVVVGEVVGQA